jgi:hypothetical protein
MNTERKYQRELIKRIRARFPSCVVMKNDASEMQGVPDILILYNNTWAMLEVKMSDVSDRQPNQEHYVRTFNNMSFAAFINPDNEEEVLDDLQSAFRYSGKACIS